MLTSSTPSRAARCWLAVLACAVLLVGACSSSDSDDASVSEAPGGVGAAVGAPSPAAAGGGSSTGDESGVDSDVAAGDDAGFDPGAGAGSAGRPGDVADVAGVDLIAAQSERRIVYTGNVASVVEDVAAAVGAAKTAAAAEGGFVFGQQSSERSATVTFKVPSIRFDAAFDAIADIGDVESQTIEADDVTEQFTDLESRRATLESSIARLRGFLDQATNADEVARLEGELTRREAERDVLAGQLRVLGDRTTFGTITAAFRLPPEDARGATAEESEDPPGFVRGLEVGWESAVIVAGTVATALGFLLPFAPVGVALVVLARWWRRRRTADRAAPVAGA